MIEYAQYRSYEELMSVLREFETRHPELISVRSIGQSLEGRDIPVAEITNRQTGSASDKPAIHVDANIHAGELTGSAVALYTIGYLLDNYGRDDLISHLLDTRTLYVVPRVSVDGAEIVLHTPQTLRSSTRLRPRFEQESGIWPEDVNGDGHILQMRVPSPRGEWKVSDLDPRLMIPRRPGDAVGSFYHILTEGRVHNEGLTPPNLARSRWHLDLNRNFPANWAPTETAGDFPLSEPESRALAEFISGRCNLSCAIAYHTAAGIIMRPPMNGPDREMESTDRELITSLARRGAEITGYPEISGYLGWSRDFPSRTAGTCTDWVYEHLGLVGFTIELWDLAKAAGIEIDDNYGIWWSDISEQNMMKLLQWNDRELGGVGFSDWRPFDHPDLGSVEIGGWHTRWVRQNPPLSCLDDIMHRNCLYVVELMAATARIEITAVDVHGLADGVSRIRVQVSNVGFLPTCATERARSIGRAEPVDVTLTGSGLSIQAGEKTQVLGHLEGYGPTASGWGYLFADRTRRSAGSAEWVVSGSGQAQIKVRGWAGGIVETTVGV